MMDRLNDKLQALILDAAKCSLIAGLSDEDDERRLFHSLGKRYLQMANDVCGVIENRQPGGLTAETDSELPP
jgi:hypothetical protein